MRRALEGDDKFGDFAATLDDASKALDDAADDRGAAREDRGPRLGDRVKRADDEQADRSTGSTSDSSQDESGKRPMPPQFRK